MNIEDSAVTGALNEIYSLNPDVYQNIVNKKDMANMDFNDLLEIKKRLKQNKVSISMKMSPKDNTIRSGCKEELIRIYNSYMMQDPDEVLGKITVGGVSVQYDIAVVRAVKALLTVGVTSNKELADSCREIVEKILVLGQHSSYVTVGDTCNRLFNKKDKFTDIKSELMKGLMEILK